MNSTSGLWNPKDRHLVVVLMALSPTILCLFYLSESWSTDVKTFSGPDESSEGDWVCPKCENVNFSFRTVCNMKKCGAPRPTPVSLPSCLDTSWLSSILWIRLKANNLKIDLHNVQNHFPFFPKPSKYDCFFLVEAKGYANISKMNRGIGHTAHTLTSYTKASLNSINYCNFIIIIIFLKC